jgi:hypothetical protein
MLKVVVAQSLEIDSMDALEEVFEQCHEKLDDLMPQAGILFAGIDHDFELILNRINEVYPGIELVGCTTDGELSSVHGYADDSVILMLFCSDELCFKTGVADGISKGTASTIRKAVDSAKSKLEGDPKLCITTPSGMTASGDSIAEGFRLGLGENFPLFGGTAGDQWRFEGTYQFCKDRVFTDAAPFLLISGPLLYSFGVQTGWMPIGKKAKVTKSDGNVVHEIGDDTAVAFYERLLGANIGVGDEEPIGEYPLAVFEEDSESFYLRSSLFLVRGTPSLTFTGDVPQGSTVQITHSTRDGVVEAAEASINVHIRRQHFVSHVRGVSRYWGHEWTRSTTLLGAISLTCLLPAFIPMEKLGLLREASLPDFIIRQFLT